jgi:hypothetical protein
MRTRRKGGRHELGWAAWVQARHHENEEEEEDQLRVGEGERGRGNLFGLAEDGRVKLLMPQLAMGASLHEGNVAVREHLVQAREYWRGHFQASLPLATPSFPHDPRDNAKHLWVAAREWGMRQSAHDG